MDNKLDCSMQGFIDIPSRALITVSLKSNPSKNSDVLNCRLQFRAQNKREYIKVEFKKFFINSCKVEVFANDVNIVLSFLN